MTDIQTAIREDFTAEHVAHLRSDARYLEARIAIAERNADAAEWEVELWTERGNTVAATRHAWKAAYHRAAADFMHQLTTDAVETATVETVETVEMVETVETATVETVETATVETVETATVETVETKWAQDSPTLARL